MGCCLSKKDPCSKSPQTQQNVVKNVMNKPHNVISQFELQRVRNAADAVVVEKEEKEKERKGEGEEGEEKEEVSAEARKKKEVFVIQHRKSNDRRVELDGVSNSSEEEMVGRNLMAAAASGQVVRTSSCTKEEVDAILIQCGRLSRSSSGKGNVNGGNGGVGGHGRRYSGSKRSFDFDRESEIDGGGNGNGVGEGEGEEDERMRRRQSRGSGRRRTTPSRSRERGDQPQRSGSRERGGVSGSGRRVSRSPGRRSESPMSQPGNGNGNGNGSSSSGNGNGGVRPGKLVSVPATVTSLSVDKGGNGNGGDNGNVKRVLVKRNVGSPRSQSPARGNQVSGIGNGNGGGQQQQPSLSRNGSRKAEQSPYRRTPLNEIDINSLPFQPLANKRPLVQKGKEVEEGVVVVKQPVSSVSQNKYIAETNNEKPAAQGTHRRTRSRGTEVYEAAQGTHRRTGSRGAEGYEVTKTNYCRVNELHTPNLEQMMEDKLNVSEYDAMVTPVIVSGTETVKLPQTLMRSRSARRSRDLDINVEALLNPTPSTDYNSLLLQDIQNFHQKKNSNANGSNNGSPPFALPPCVSKACSIVEAVADLNSTTGSNISFPFSEDKRVSPRAAAETANNTDTNFSFHQSKQRLDSKDPFIESEVNVGNDLMEPSLHKYVTVRKRGGDMDDEESSGSNSIVGGNHQNWVSSSSWEPTSADSTDCWSSKSYTRVEGFSPVVFQRHAISDFACGFNEDSEKNFGKNGRDSHSGQQHIGAARSRTGGSRGPIQSSKAAAVSM